MRARSCCSAPSRSARRTPRTDLFHKTLELFGPITVDGLAAIASGRRDFVPQDRSRASFFHKRSSEDIRIDWTWSAEELERLVRAQSAPYPQAFCFHKGRRLEIVTAAVSQAVYGGTPGRIFFREGDGVAIVAGAEARRGRSRALADPLGPHRRGRGAACAGVLHDHGRLSHQSPGPLRRIPGVREPKTVAVGRTR